MRKTITINIPEPCHEDWSKMTPKEKGRYCNACDKTVVDLTKKTDEQIIKVLESEGKLCGRFKSQQLDRELVLQRKDKSDYLSWVASGLFAFFALGSQDIQAQGKPKIVQTDTINSPQIKGKIANSILQEKVITGTVTTADDGLPLPGASVIIKGTSRGQQTDFDGNFKIKASVGDILSIQYVGMVDKEITIGKSSTLMIELTLDNCLLESVVVGYVSTSYDKPDHSRFFPSNGYFHISERQQKWKQRNRERRARYKAEKKAKRDAVRNGERERTAFGKFFFNIKTLFSKK